MTSIIRCSVGNISVLPTATVIPSKDIRVTRCSLAGKPTRLTSSSQRLLLLQSSLRLFQSNGSSCCLKQWSSIRTVAAVGADVTVEESNSVPSEETDEVTEAPQNAVGSSDIAQGNPTATTKATGKRPRTLRKSEMPPVKNEELVPGATFTGKVVSIQPFGAFVDFGAFTDGLVHVSRLSDGFVKDVGTLVSLGQEVKVRIVEVNMESGRISLTMRDGEDATKPEQKKDAPTGGSRDTSKPRPVRRNSARSNQKRDEAQKTSKFVKGQILDGTVKNLTRSGAFVSLPEGEEGFLPHSEEPEGLASVLGNSSLQVGQEVNVRVLRITRGQVTLTRKKEEDVEQLNKQLNQGVVHVATNPFELAFRNNKDIAAYLNDREQAQKASKVPDQIGGNLAEIQTQPHNLEVEDSIIKTDVEEVSAPSASDVEREAEEASPKELPDKDSVVDLVPTKSDEGSEIIVQESANAILEEKTIGTSIKSTTSPVLNETSIPEGKVNTDGEAGIPSTQTSDSLLEKLLEEKEDSVNLGGSSAELVLGEISKPDNQKDYSTESTKTEEAVVSPKSSSSEQVESSADVLSASIVIEGASVTNEGVEAGKEEVNEAHSTSGSVSANEDGFQALDGEVTEPSTTDSVTHESPVAEKVNPEEINGSKPISDSVTSEVETKTHIEQDKIPSADLKEAKMGTSDAQYVESDNDNQRTTIKATISPALVKQLREETGAGMMDCKKALEASGGDIGKAHEFLRKKGLASADKKASRATAEGRIGSYIHDNRIGVLIEVNCETDFVSRGEIFKDLVDDLAMQVAACPQVQYLVTEDVPEEIVNKEKQIEMQKEDLLTKPEQIRSKIVDGRIKKRLEELALLEQPYIKNDKLVVKDWVKQTIATIGENIKVKRFVRYNLGEGLEKKSQDFAAEVAAQTAARSASPQVPTDQSAESKETVEKPPAATVSAALVKQLREETGAGMMDCKKALTETGGNLEKAQEYLRKKGLSSADKKSSRLAAEGRIAAYIHDSRIGSLIEVNCETDFVGRSEKFKELVEDLAMQVVACPQVDFVSVEEIPESIVNKEKEVEKQREDLQLKPENIREKIVEGRISKRLGELALREQPFIKDDSIKVKDLVNQTIAALGENIKVRRFIRFTLGENKV